MRNSDGLLAGGVIVAADDRTGSGQRIGDFCCFFRSVYSEVLKVILTARCCGFLVTNLGTTPLDYNGAPITW